MPNNPVQYVTRSMSEGWLDEPHGAFWSNEHGWTSLSEATRFNTQERMEFGLPATASGDAEWMLLEEALDLQCNK